MKGFGAVVTGTSISGRTSVGEDLRIYPTEQVAKIRGIQVHSQAVGEVEAGHRTAINLQGVDIADIERGMVLAPPGSLQANYMLDCQFLYLAANAKPLKHRTRMRVHLGTAEILGRVSLLDRDELQPGEEAAVQLLLEAHRRRLAGRPLCDSQLFAGRHHRRRHGARQRLPPQAQTAAGK